MVKFVLFLKKIYVLLLFIFLESLCLNYYASSTSYTKARLLTLSNSMVGGIYEGFSTINNYVHLGRENKVLTQEISRLRNKLEIYQNNTLDTTLFPEEIAAYQYMPARVVGNSVTRQENFLTIDKGLRDDVDAKMAVISPEGGIVGYVLSCSDKFAACISLLNTKFHTSGKFKNAEYVGAIHWDGASSTHVTLSDIPKYAQINKGDTIVTSNYSSIFPPGMLIGTVDSWKMNDRTYCFDVKITLLTRISSIREVILVRFTDAEERSSLESSHGY